MTNHSSSPAPKPVIFTSVTGHPVPSPDTLEDLKTQVGCLYVDILRVNALNGHNPELSAVHWQKFLNEYRTFSKRIIVSDPNDPFAGD